jgi:4-alpha-glucanotransferase
VSAARRARGAGVNVPLFSARSSRSWGIGELPDLVPLASWAASAGFDRLMLLPLGTMPDGETSPYAASSTMSIDPVFIAPDDVSDFTRVGGIDRLSPNAIEARAAARNSDRVRYDLVRAAKREALEHAFEAFVAEEWSQFTTRASHLAVYIARERWWLDDYALFHAISRTMPDRSWRDWPDGLRDHDARAVDDARRQFARDVLREQYWQWIAEGQWQQARRAAAAKGVKVFGDLPFVAATHSADVWARQEEFRLDVSAGVPPDAFSEDGQDWGLPTYRWERIAQNDYEWIRRRARRMASLFDGLRVDHVIGLFRTYGRPREGTPFFTPADEDDQRRQGETIVSILRDAGIDLIAEDLGTVPDFVRASLTSLGVPGCRVLRWERDWHAPTQPFLDPATFPARSAALTGTHDTEPLAAWWDQLPVAERAQLLALPGLASRGLVDALMPWSPALHEALVAMAMSSGSDQVFLPIQDVFGIRDRINVPGTVGPKNWTWCLPWPVEALPQQF